MDLKPNAKSTVKICSERKFCYESPGLQKAEDIWQSYNGYVKKNGEDLPSNLVELEQLYKTSCAREVWGEYYCG